MLRIVSVEYRVTVRVSINVADSNSFIWISLSALVMDDVWDGALWATDKEKSRLACARHARTMVSAAGKWKRQKMQGKLIWAKENRTNRATHTHIHTTTHRDTETQLATLWIKRIVDVSSVAWDTTLSTVTRQRHNAPKQKDSSSSSGAHDKSAVANVVEKQCKNSL